MKKTRTLKRSDARQVDVRHVGNVREVVRQHEAATVAEVDGAAAVLEADVADEADDAASDGAWRNENIGWMRRFFWLSERSRKGVLEALSYQLLRGSWTG